MIKLMGISSGKAHGQLVEVADNLRAGHSVVLASSGQKEAVAFFERAVRHLSETSVKLTSVDPNQLTLTTESQSGSVGRLRVSYPKKAKR